MGYSLELSIAIESTDSNRILGRSWKAKHSVFERVKNEIFLKSRGKTPETPLKNFTISVHRYSPKTMDWDNFVASLKPAIDGLKLAGIIEDDRWEFIKQINTNQTISHDKKLIILVKERESHYVD